MKYKIVIGFKSGSQVSTEGDEDAKDVILKIMDSFRSTITFQNGKLCGMKLNKKEIEYVTFEQVKDVKRTS